MSGLSQHSGGGDKAHRIALLPLQLSRRYDIPDWLYQTHNPTRASGVARSAAGGHVSSGIGQPCASGTAAVLRESLWPRSRQGRRAGVPRKPVATGQGLPHDSGRTGRMPPDGPPQGDACGCGVIAPRTVAHAGAGGTDPSRGSGACGAADLRRCGGRRPVERVRAVAPCGSARRRPAWPRPHGSVRDPCRRIARRVAGRRHCALRGRRRGPSARKRPPGGAGLTPHARNLRFARRGASLAQGGPHATSHLGSREPSSSRRSGRPDRARHPPDGARPQCGAATPRHAAEGTAGPARARPPRTLAGRRLRRLRNVDSRQNDALRVLRARGGRTGCHAGRDGPSLAAGAGWPRPRDGGGLVPVSVRMRRRPNAAACPQPPSHSPPAAR